MKLSPRNRWALLALLALFAVLLVPIPAFGTRLGAEVEDLSHAPLFAAVALGGWFWLRAGAAVQRPLLASVLRAWLLAAALAVITETVQPLTGREGSLHDVYTDLTGAGAALLAVVAVRMARGSWRRRLSIAGVLIASAVTCWPVAYAVAAYRHRSAMAPQLLDLGDDLGRFFVQRHGIHVIPHAAGGWLISPLQSPWPGLTVDEVLPDWRGYRDLLVDVSNPGSQPVTLLIRIDDRGPVRRYADHYSNSTVLAPGARVMWRLPLAGLQRRTAGRSLDLAAMRRVILFQDTTAPGSSAPPYVLHDLRLEP
jgi:hypothetical protein